MENKDYHGQSAYENQQVIDFLFEQHLHINEVLDVGAGAGYYGKLIDNRAKVTAVEVWKPSVEHLESLGVYDKVIHTDIRNFTYKQPYDLVIFGDVLEHLEFEDALSVWTRAMENARIVVVSIPNGNYPQSAIHGNTHEAHLIENAEQDLIPFLDTPTATWRYPVTTTYLWENLE